MTLRGGSVRSQPRLRTSARRSTRGAAFADLGRDGVGRRTRSACHSRAHELHGVKPARAVCELGDVSFSGQGRGESDGCAEVAVSGRPPKQTAAGQQCRPAQTQMRAGAGQACSPMQHQMETEDVMRRGGSSSACQSVQENSGCSAVTCQQHARSCVDRQAARKRSASRGRQAGCSARGRLSAAYLLSATQGSTIAALQKPLSSVERVNTRQHQSIVQEWTEGRGWTFKQGAQRSHTQLMVEPGASRRIRSSPREQRCQPACICCASSCCASFPPLPRAQTPDSTLLCSCTAQADTLCVARS